MPAITSVASAIDDPITFLSQYDGTLAVLTNIEGSSYRQVGTLMAFGTNGIRVSSISSGCFDEALAAEAEAAFVEGTVRQVRYGHGSPFIDIQLPCGAGLDVTFIPQPNRNILQRSATMWSRRQAHVLSLNPQTGLIRIEESDGLVIHRIPPARFVVFGQGTETISFAKVAMGTGLLVEVFSPDLQVLAVCETARLLVAGSIPRYRADSQTAIATFFHDHDWELAILEQALSGPAFWIGAQGSKAAHHSRCQALMAQGVNTYALSRLRGPIGMIPSTRDPLTLSVSVLAEIMAAYQERYGAHP